MGRPRRIASAERGLRVALVLLALLTLAYVVHATQLLDWPVDLDQGEGYDTWSAWLIRQGQWPYTQNGTYPYYSSNYPPVWSAVVALPMVVTGPQIGTARAVSILAALGCALLIAGAAYRMGRGVASKSVALLAGGVAAACFLSSPYVFHTTPLARVNSLALCFSLAGLSLCERPTRRRLVLAGAVFLAALFTKQTTADAVAAAVIFVALSDLRRGLVFGGAICAAGAVLLMVINSATQGAFWLNVVSGNANPFDFGQLVGYVRNYVEVHVVVWLGAVLVTARYFVRREWSPWVVYLPAAQIGALTVGKWGAGESYFLSLIAASCVLFGCLVAQVWQRPADLLAVRPLGRAVPQGLALSVVLLLQGLLFLHGPLALAPPWLGDRGFQAEALGASPTDEQRAEAALITAEVEQRDGPVLAEDSGFVLAGGKPVVGNPTHLRNLYEAGLWHPAELVAQIDRHEFDLVILHAQLYPPPVLEAIGRSYYLAQTIKLGAAEYGLFFPGGD